MRNKSLEIFYSIGESYVQHTAVSIISLLENNTTLSPKINIISNSISEKSKSILHNICDNYGIKRIKFHTIDENLVRHFPLSIGYITNETYFRYYIAAIAHNSDRALYLDADTVVTGDISDLADVELTGYYAAGVSDNYIENIGYKKELNFTPDDLYINAGVILLNLEAIRKDGIIEKLCSATTLLSSKIRYQDQDVINIVLKGKIKEIPSCFNFTTSDVFRRSKEDFFNAKILHFTGQKKPWTRFLNTGSFSELYYYKYLKLTPFNKVLYKWVLTNPLRLIYSTSRIGPERIIRILGLSIKYSE